MWVGRLLRGLLMMSGMRLSGLVFLYVKIGTKSACNYCYGKRKLMVSSKPAKDRTEGSRLQTQASEPVLACDWQVAREIVQVSSGRSFLSNVLLIDRRPHSSSFEDWRRQDLENGGCSGWLRGTFRPPPSPKKAYPRTLTTLNPS